jgi:diacylglycerol kinase (ATP)
LVLNEHCIVLKRVLSVLDELDLKNNPSVAILPLGTGNDLARTLGWGGGYNNESLEAYFNKVINGKSVKLDRWTIVTKKLNVDSDSIASDSKSSSSGEAKDKLPLTVMNNYFSIGADAKIALDFHAAREKNPELFTSQAFNKIEYAKVISIS